MPLEAEIGLRPRRRQGWSRRIERVITDARAMMLPIGLAFLPRFPGFSPASRTESNERLPWPA